MIVFCFHCLKEVDTQTFSNTSRNKEFSYDVDNVVTGEIKQVKRMAYGDFKSSTFMCPHCNKETGYFKNTREIEVLKNKLGYN